MAVVAIAAPLPSNGAAKAMAVACLLGPGLVILRGKATCNLDQAGTWGHKFLMQAEAM
jgi:hypothetical protein